MQLSQLEYLQAVANYGGVRKAARAVHVSPQAVSSAIKSWNLSIRLFCSTDRRGGYFVSCGPRVCVSCTRDPRASRRSQKVRSIGERRRFARRPFPSLRPLSSRAGRLFPKIGMTRLKVRTLRFTLMCGISQRLHVLNHLCLAFRMRPSHLRNQGTVSFLRNTWAKRSSRFFRAQRVINLWVQ